MRAQEFLSEYQKIHRGRRQVWEQESQEVVREELDPFRLERLDPQTRRVLQRMADHAEPGSWLSAELAYATQLGLRAQEIQRFVDLWRQITGKR